ncbi:MAG: 50S ribosomal protein L6 [Buchnera aphidicola (Periphyllus lyropictus)]|uniref:50S ribosomal protein L6 n=1 Tax=Buchnera aphidicola TaxID=9 RepID=UPI001EC22FEE|nr:50S ribosomal protein L6 [Buchnera aphidicola]NIH16488.1 50S ribosomal protein L6 [Buchnera aphidicola (Periphyllus lyropictus)]USS94773.1 50S ribosomal protein L6 [Buchnera aphidicola (Periphyllus lyropictus)]
MSRIAKRSIIVPDNIQIKLKNKEIIVKGNKGTLKKKINNLVYIKYKKNILSFKVYKSNNEGWMQAGTARSLVYSMIIGVTKGFSKKLILIGVGYRFSLEGNNNEQVVMSLGYSHNIRYILPDGIFVKLLSQTEIVVLGIDKQLVGQVSANLRFYRVPDSYKGKGVRYFNEFVKIKEAKKK